MKFKAVIFDLDGTLLYTLKDIADSGNFALEQMGFPTHPVDDYRYFIGEGIETAMSRTLPEEKRDEKTVAECVRIYREDYSHRWRKSSKPYDGIAEVLKRLKQMGIKTAVLSNKPDDFTRIMVNELLGNFDFETVQGSLPGVPDKPDPGAALNIAKKMKIAPENCIYIGDSDIDMKTARAAGMYAVGALWGYRTADELKRAGANKIIEKPTELLELFES
ncbi:MAG: HAD family hydrolase [Phycisphaerae bacterium]|jgi:phosphoglycolate phosphatase